MAQSLPHPLSAVRAERGWTYQQVASIVAGRVGNMAAHRDKVYRWERHGVEPEPEAQLALAAALTVPAQAVRELGWPSWLLVAAGPDVRLPWTVANCLTVLEQTAGAAMLDRREFFILSTGAVATVANHWLTAEPQRLTAALNGGKIDATLLGILERRVSDLRDMLGALSGPTVQTMADTDLRTVTSLLTNATYSEHLGQRLYSLAADLGRVAGMSSFTAGYPAAAERYCLAALRAAHIADDRLLGAFVLRELSTQYIESDRPDEAQTLARSAQVSTRDAPARVVAMVKVEHARAHARLGQAADCERLLAAAETTMNRADDQATPDWLSYFDNAAFSYHVGLSYTELARHDAADRWHTQSHELDPTNGISILRAQRRLWHADTALGLGDVERACALAGEALPSIAVARTPRHRRHLAKLHTRLTQHHPKVPAVTDLDEQIRTLTPPAA